MKGLRRPFFFDLSVNQSPSTTSRNFRYHFIEGSLYLASFAFLNVQVVYPALVTKLGGGNIAVGALPVLMYLLYFLPQVFAANYAGLSAYRRPWVLSAGLAQRLQVLLMALLIVLLGGKHPTLALVFFFLSFGANQILAAISSPHWFDYLAKTTLSDQRGRLMGMRSSFGALMGFLNSIILTTFLAYLPFPWDYGGVFFAAFLYQLVSWFVLRKVSGEQPSDLSDPVPLQSFLGRVREIINADVRFKRFLVASGLSVIGLMSSGFFTVAALTRFSLPERYVGFFTMTFLGAQVVFGPVLGWIADRRGHRTTLMICAASMIVATAIAIGANDSGWFFIVFGLLGMLTGMELITRYNFASACATDVTRPLYIGIMNAWLAPFYLSSLLGGWLSDVTGYQTVFVVGGIFALAGFVLLTRIEDPVER